MQRSQIWNKKYGPWAVVTGASDGIGRAMAVRLAASGLHMVLIARRKEILRLLAEELMREHGVECRVLAVDLGKEEGIRAVVDATQDLDVGLLAAAAGFGTSGPLLETDLETELDMVDVNCRAVLALSQHFGRRLAARGRGGMILLSSLVAFQGVPRAANYAATKAYVQSLAEGLRWELAPLGVDVVASAPGPVRSGFGARANMRMGLALTPERVAEVTLKALGRRSVVRPGWLSKFLEASLAPLPRWGRVRILKMVMEGMTKHQDEETQDETHRSA